MQLRIEEEKKAAEAARAKKLIDDQLRPLQEEKVRVMWFIYALYCESYHTYMDCFWVDFYDIL